MEVKKRKDALYELVPQEASFASQSFSFLCRRLETSTKGASTSYRLPFQPPRGTKALISSVDAALLKNVALLAAESLGNMVVSLSV